MAVSDIYLGNIVTAGAVLSAAWRKAWTLLKTQIVVGLMFAGLFIGIGIVLGCRISSSYVTGIPRIVVGILISWDSSPPWFRAFRSFFLILDRARCHDRRIEDGREIRHRSWGLVKGNRGKVFLVFLVIVVIQILVQAGVGLVATLELWPWQRNRFHYFDSSTDIVSILLSPVSAIAVTLLYYDFRIRKEGFDLEMLSQSIGGPATEA